jgi:protein SCO1/2
MADLSRVMRLLGDRADEVNVVMVSVDSGRDTPEKLANYLANFNEQFVGLAPDDETLRRIGPDYGLYVQRQNVPGTSADYLIDHSTPLYLLNSESELTTIYGYGIPPEVVANDLEELLTEEAASS